MKSEPVSKKNPKDLLPSPELEELQSLMPIDEKDLARLVDDIKKSGEVRDPIKIYVSADDDYLILGGLNRWKIALELGLSEVPTQIYKGTLQEYRELVINDNLNRRHLTIDQKKKIAIEFFKIAPDRSALSVAKQTGLDDKTAGKIKTDLKRRSEIPNVPIKDTKGRQQPATKPTKPKVRPSDLPPLPEDEYVNPTNKGKDFEQFLKTRFSTEFKYLDKLLKNLFLNAKWNKYGDYGIHNKNDAKREMMEYIKNRCNDLIDE